MTKPQFAAIPLRAIGDPELTDGDMRVLAVVAAFDRLSHARGTGQGAWASHNTMSAWIGRNYSNFSTTMNKLLKLGYVVREPRETDRRQFTYRVVYSDDDRVPRAQKVCPEANDRAEIVCPTDDNSPEIVCPEGVANPQKSADFGSEYIPQRVVIDSAEAEEIDSPEGAHRAFSAPRDRVEEGLGRGDVVSIAARLPKSFNNLKVETQLVIFERHFGDIGRDAAALGDGERQAFVSWLGQVADTSDLAVASQAQRLLEEVMVW